MQLDRTLGSRRFINAGSVGMPYAAPGAYWALLGPGVQLRQTLYDFDGAAARIRRSAHPMAEDFAENNILRPPSSQDVTTFFMRIAVQRGQPI